MVKKENKILYPQSKLFFPKEGMNKFYMNTFLASDIDLIVRKLDELIAGIRDKAAKHGLKGFIKKWQITLPLLLGIKKSHFFYD